MRGIPLPVSRIASLQARTWAREYQVLGRALPCGGRIARFPADVVRRARSVRRSEPHDSPLRRTDLSRLLAAICSRNPVADGWCRKRDDRATIATASPGVEVRKTHRGRVGPSRGGEFPYVLDSELHEPFLEHHPLVIAQAAGQGLQVSAGIAAPSATQSLLHLRRLRVASCCLCVHPPRRTRPGWKSGRCRPS